MAQSPFQLPPIVATPWSKAIKNAPPEALDLLGNLLRYNPNSRLKALEACAHPFFDDIRYPEQFKTQLFLEYEHPPLLNWSIEELQAAGPLAEKLLSRENESEPQVE